MVTEAKLEPLNQLFLFTKHPVDLKHRRTQNIHRGLFVVVLAEDLEAQISLCQWTHCGVQLTKGPLPCGDSLISQRVTLFTVNTPPRQAVLSCIFATCTFSHRNHKEGLKPHKYAIFQKLLSLLSIKVYRTPLMRIEPANILCPAGWYNPAGKWSDGGIYHKPAPRNQQDELFDSSCQPSLYSLLLVFSGILACIFQGQRKARLS